MTATDERRNLGELAEQTGWQRTDLDRADRFIKGTVRIRVVWQGDTAISGATLYQDDIMTSYTRDVGTVSGWLKR
jgi:hypothetical protein